MHPWINKLIKLLSCNNWQSAISVSVILFLCPGWCAPLKPKTDHQNGDAARRAARTLLSFIQHQAHIPILVESVMRGKDGEGEYISVKFVYRAYMDLSFRTV
jgi:hypothetical protein